MENLVFKDMALSDEIQRAIVEMGFEEATPIQSQSIQHIMDGKDVIGQAQTGTGKTCAFGIPAVEMMEAESEAIQVLVLCPTRELAIQSAEELKAVSKYKPGIKILPIYGGQPIDRQIMALKKRPQIIIGTPGRIMDHMRRKTLKLSELKMIILDEADEMLNMGFREDIDTILEKIPGEKQTIFFSATMPKEILELTKKYQNDPVHIRVSHKELTVPNIEQFYLEVGSSARLEVLCRIIDANNFKLSLVFCNTKKRVDELASSLQSRGYSAECLHGDMRQTERDKVMNQFRKGKLDVLIATDVAARGIDVDDVEAVFNFDIPNDEEYYVHRIGRTGRAGRTGKSYTFVWGREIYKLKDIQRYTKSIVKQIKAPSLSEVEETKMGKLLNSVKKALSDGQYEKFSSYVEQTMEDFNAGNGEESITIMDIAGALLKLYSEANGVVTDQNDVLKDLMKERSEEPQFRGQSSRRDFKSPRGGNRGGNSEGGGRYNKGGSSEGSRYNKGGSSEGGSRYNKGGSSEGGSRYNKSGSSEGGRYNKGGSGEGGRSNKQGGFSKPKWNKDK